MAGLVRSAIRFPPGNFELMEELYDDCFEPTEEDVLDQCYTMGIDPIKEEDLVHIAIDALKAPLPQEWKPISHGEEIFFHNFVTGESLWEHPSDRYYMQVLQNERAKKAASVSNIQMTDTRKGSSFSLVPSKPPELPAPLQPLSLKKPILAPIGGNTSLKPSPLPPVGDLQSHKVPVGPLNPLQTLKKLTDNTLSTTKSGGVKNCTTVAISVPTNGTTEPTTVRAASISTTTTVPASTTVPTAVPTTVPASTTVPTAVPTTVPASTTVPTAIPTTVPASTTIPTAVLPASITIPTVVPTTLASTTVPTANRPISAILTATSNRSLLGRKINIGTISTEFNEEDEEDNSSTSSVSQNDSSKDDNFVKKYNIKGIGDDFVDDDDNKIVQEDNNIIASTSQLQPVSLNSLQHSQSLINTCTSQHIAATTKSLYTQPFTSTDVILSNVSLQSKAPSVSESAKKLAVAKERAELEKNHYENLERLREEHAKEIEKHKEQYFKEFDDEKTLLKQENQMKLALVKQQMELEYNSQEMKIHQEQEQALAFLRKEYTDNLDEEEAILEEKKQDALRNLRKKIEFEQEEEQKKLKQSKDELLKEMKSKFDQNLEEEKEGLKNENAHVIENLKLAMREEMETERMRLKELNAKELNETKEKLAQELEKAKQELEVTYQQELADLKKNLSEEHSKCLEAMKSSLLEEFEIQKVAIEEQRSLQKAVEEEAVKSLEEKKKQLMEDEEKEKEKLKVTLSKEFDEIKKRHSEELRKEEERQEIELEKQKENYNKTIVAEKARLDTELKQEMERHQEMLRKERERHKEEIIALQSSLATEKQNKLRELELNISEQESQKKAKLEEMIKKLHKETEEIKKMKEDLQNEKLMVQQQNEMKEQNNTFEANAETVKDAVASSELTDVKPKLKEEEEDQLETMKNTRKAVAKEIELLKQEKQKLQVDTKKLLQDQLLTHKVEHKETTPFIVHNKKDTTSEEDSTIVLSSNPQKISNTELNREMSTFDNESVCHSLSHVSSSLSHKLHSSQDDINVRTKSQKLSRRKKVKKNRILFDRIQAKLNEEAAVIKHMEQKLHEGDKKVNQLTKNLQTAFEESENPTTADHLSDSKTDDSITNINNAPSPPPELSTSSQIALLRRQLIREGLIKEQSNNTANSRFKNGSSRRRDEEPLRLEDLQESSGVSSTCSDLSLSSESSPGQLSDAIRTSFVPVSNSADFRSIRKTDSSTSTLTSALGKINTQLEEVLERLDTPRVHFKEQTPRWADRVEPFNVPANEVISPSDFNVKLQQKWNEYIDSSAKRLNSYNRLPPPPPPALSTSKLDQAGRELIQKQKDWLAEFRRSLPKT